MYSETQHMHVNGVWRVHLLDYSNMKCFQMTISQWYSNQRNSAPAYLSAEGLLLVWLFNQLCGPISECGLLAVHSGSYLTN